MVGAGMKVRLELGNEQVDALMESLRHGRYSVTADRPQELPDKGDRVVMTFHDDAESTLAGTTLVTHVAELTPIGEALRLVLTPEA